MTWDTSLTACAALVEKADPDRFRATMAAPVDARAILFPIYAFNVEVSRAPWVTAEPMIAEMRLQWWRDALEEIAKGQTVRKHEVTTALAEVLTPEQASALDELIAARRWDIYKDAFEDDAHLTRYLTQTAGTLMQAAAQSLGAEPSQAILDIGYAHGVAGWLKAVPELAARGRIPLLDGTHAGVQTLAQSGLDRLTQARKATIDAKAKPALLAAWQTEGVLKQALKDPSAVGDGRLGLSAFQKSARLAWQAATGRV